MDYSGDPGAESLPELHDANARGSGEEESDRGTVQVAAHLPGRQADPEAGGRGQDTDDLETVPQICRGIFCVVFREGVPERT